MKCPRTAAHPSTNDYWVFHPAKAGQVMAIKKNKNKHMISPRTVVHPAHMSIGDSIWQN